MASVAYEKRTGRRRILFTAPDGKRKTIRLGKANAKQAVTAKGFIEDLVSCRFTGGAPRPATSAWIGGLGDVFRKRIEKVRLIEPRARREVPTLGAWLAAYIAGRTDVKPGTRTNMGQTERYLKDHFGRGKRLDEITPGDADGWRIALKERGLSEGTIRRQCKRAKQFFAAAVRKRIIEANPFDGMKCGHYANAERFYFVSREEAQVVLDACPDTEWRLIFALCRYGGLRCPSEVLRLSWADVDWERMRFTVHAAKTEHYDGGGIRVVPIFPELYPYLRDAFEQAEEGTVHAITRYRDTNANLRTQLGRIIKRAALTPWPKRFQNLRSTCETELAERFPMHVVCKWLGNSEPVAARHYLQLTEDHYRKAAQNPAQYPAAEARKGTHREQGADKEPAICGALREGASPCKDKDLRQVTPRGLEPEM